MPPKRYAIGSRKEVERADYKSIRLENMLDISEWLEDDTFKDCVLKSADNDEIRVHRIVLAQVSEPFKAMLTTDMRERQTNVITLPEETHVLERLVDLVYCGAFDGNYKDLMELSVATKKYLMMDLHEECVKKLKEFLQPSTAVELLTVAVENEFEDVQAKALKCIGRNFETIRNSDSWDLLLENHEVLNMAVDAYIKHIRREREIQMNRSTIEAISMDLNSSDESSEDSD